MRRIVPAMNRCVIFETTERSWHGFDRIALPPDHAALSRKSVALYFYSKQRPQAEIAGKHTTHYVNRQLPERFAPGYTLRDDDATTLRELIAHRDHQLQRLYAENAELLQARDRGGCTCAICADACRTIAWVKAAARYRCAVIRRRRSAPPARSNAQSGVRRDRRDRAATPRPRAESRAADAHRVRDRRRAG